MKKLIFVLCLFSSVCSAQNALIIKAGNSLPHNTYGFIGAQVQLSMLGIEVEWRPYHLAYLFKSDGMSLGVTLSLYPYQNTPFSSMRVITKGKSIIDDYTQRAERSLTWILGYRWYPFNPKSCHSVNRFFIDGGIGADYGNKKINNETRAVLKFAAEISANFIICKY
jgi:hypothetical protein